MPSLADASAPARLTGDPHRPQYHFLPPANWMNDPNGLIHWKGQYHLFYQYNPKGPFHDRIHWGHAVSDDLVHWTNLPIALAPTRGGPDADGCWSGCAVDNDGTPTLLYTGVHPQTVCMATSDDDLLTWTKYAGNPLISGPPSDISAGAPWDFRDPYVWRENDTWLMVIGSREKGKGGMALLYRSDDLAHWEYLHPLLSGDMNEADPFWTGAMWECPNFLALDDRHALIVSVAGGKPNELMYTAYFTGTYADYKFVPEARGILDHGGYFYAPQVLRDPEGRHIMWGWVREGRSRAAIVDAGWAGVTSLPRLLTPGAGGALDVRPVPELSMLRGRRWHCSGIDLTPASVNVLGDERGDCLEIIAEFDEGDASEFGIKVRCSPDGEEQTRIICDRSNGRAILDCVRSSLNPETRRDVREAPIEPATGAPLRLHIFLDRSMLEVIVNNRAWITSRIYPSRADSLGLDLFARGGSVRLMNLEVWQMGSIW